MCGIYSKFLIQRNLHKMKNLKLNNHFIGKKQNQTQAPNVSRTVLVRSYQEVWNRDVTQRKYTSLTTVWGKFAFHSLASTNLGNKECWTIHLSLVSSVPPYGPMMHNFSNLLFNLLILSILTKFCVTKLQELYRYKAVPYFKLIC